MAIAIKKYVPEQSYLKALICGNAGSGKAQPLSAKILTPTGRVNMGELKVGDLVIGGDGMATKVTGIFPQGVQDIYEVVFEDGGKTRCTLDHLWTVTKTKNKNADTVMSLKEIIENPMDKRKDRKANYYIPYVGAIEKDPLDYGIHPYVMGVLLGDGGLHDRTPMIHTEDWILDKVDNLIPGNMIVHRRTKISDGVRTASIKNKQYEKNGNFIRKMLEEYGLAGKHSYDKFIPDQYKNGSIEQRIELLQGLFDTDGSPVKSKDSETRGTLEYSTTSERLKDDVCEILHSLGIKFNVKEKLGSYKKDGERIFTRINYRIYVKQKEGFQLFSLPRKNILKETQYKHVRLITSINKVGREEAQCIKVDNKDELYVTDDYIVTHNTTLGSTAPNPLFICVENGLLSIADKSPLMVEIRSVEDLRETLKYLKKEFALPKKERELQIDTIVIDSLSEMAETIKNKLTQEGAKSMTMRDWGVLGDELMGIFRAFIALPCNVVALSHIKEDKDEDSGSIIYNPSLSGRAKEEVLRAFDIITYIFLDKKGNRTVTAKEAYNTKAKCRSQALAKLESLPFDIQEWMKTINENTSFGKSEEVVKISETPDAPTPEVKAMWDAVTSSLMEDNTPKNKQAIKEKAQASQKIGQEEKNWILMMIDNF